MCILLIVRRVFGRDAGMIIMSFIRTPMKEIERRRKVMLNHIFRYAKNSDFNRLTAFEVCQIYSSKYRELYLVDKGWVRVVNLLLELTEVFNAFYKAGWEINWYHQSRERTFLEGRIRQIRNNLEALGIHRHIHMNVTLQVYCNYRDPTCHLFRENYSTIDANAAHLASNAGSAILMADFWTHTLNI